MGQFAHDAAESLDRDRSERLAAAGDAAGDPPRAIPPPEALEDGVEPQRIERVVVRITNPTRTIVDLFRYRRVLGQGVAIEGLRLGLRQGKVTPGEISRCAAAMKVWPVLQPYLDALTIDG
ncbi:MAG: type IV toxin-antitoxin system AbiEi family antitoxin domain-containing protein [Inquilinus sp.]|uniref:type IV toxin-antitoxin system AbiEi family antitoxin domain-containing protein n=1 Tax=Inquilinus sp. TaxID=1932117 RepID=UPI003F30CE64